ncbi:MAG: HD domain-containing protein [Desulfobacterales bacterium]|jgi:HD superfamily phosphodiesterase|nr:HD domain-containing protein [Desulfobacteraceae bacterium]MBT4363724.1 HD domain-containing protein [Desulfobacteraceae bacterium]MBT7086471.1 HD domain-containing protein [Desulfobacterales bacterium]MBT7695871.1 HD domain-containing protein [Desulfobacterales bacterium]
MKCPGQDSQYWKPGAIFDAKCPECGAEVEFFKDDTTRRCHKCGHKFLNPGLDFGCASYCQYADQCIGNLPPELLAQQEDLLKDRVAIEMKKYFKSDFKRIGHATKVARYSEQIGKQEGGNLAVILSASYLHDIGIREAEQKYNNTAPKYQEELGPPIAREILEKLGAKQELIDEVCDIIAHHHHPKDVETANFKILYDADLIVNLEEKHKENPISPEKVENLCESSFLTETGKEKAKEALMNA